MTPREFIEKWRASPKDERRDSQTHFNDLCGLLGVDAPSEIDPAHEWFTFEKGVGKTTGGHGWADVWRRGAFGWEYKGGGGDLSAAYRQLLNYSVALENPPLLIVSDMDRILIHTNWTNTVQKVHEFRLEDLEDAAARDILKAAFTDPDRLKPAKTRQMLTEEAASTFANLAHRLRGRGHDGGAVAHFVNRLVFCMFAEDVGLLPSKMFQRVLELSVKAPGEFRENAQLLFAAMKDGGKVGLEKVEWFNGGLFDSDEALPLEAGDVRDVLAAAKLDWSDIDPSILGTLFERGLDPDKRSQLGAHYTDRDKIMLIVNPVIVEPLTSEWEAIRAEIAGLIEAALKETPEKLLRGADLAARTRALKRAESLHEGFIRRLRDFRVLDPACGSGNFLYLALLALKDLEHRANLDAETLGLPRGFPGVGPECVKGIEINAYAAELARVSVWIGEIQWMRRNGFEAARDPILRPLGTIECRDAVLNEEGTRAEWPKADVVVGNPPFLGNKKMIRELGEDYTVALRAAWPTVPGGVDLVMYWFAKAWELIEAGRAQRAGLVATNSIRGGANRKVIKPVVARGRIFNAWDDEEWTVEGAAVRVSLVCFDNAHGGPANLDGSPVEEVVSDLTANAGGVDITGSAILTENKGFSFQGPVKVGAFDIAGDQARQWLKLPLNPNGRPNTDVLRPWANGMDVTRRPSGKWIIDFGEMLEDEAAFYEGPFQYVCDTIKPGRDKNRDRQRREKWWRLGRSGAELKGASEGLERIIITPRVAKYRLLVWGAKRILPDSAVVVIARDDDTTFGVLHSRFHELWSLRMGTWLGKGNDPRYTPSTTFETFPFPAGLTPDIPAAEYAGDPRAQAIAAAAARLDELRENWLNPADLVERVAEVVPGYPDRILPRDDAAAAVLKKRTLTNLYNARPTWLDHAHRALDEAVAEAYGWGDDWRAGLLKDDEILARLFRLNQERAAAEVGGLA